MVFSWEFHISNLIAANLDKSCIFYSIATLQLSLVLECEYLFYEFALIANSFNRFPHFARCLSFHFGSRNYQTQSQGSGKKTGKAVTACYLKAQD